MGLEVQLSLEKNHILANLTMMHLASKTSPQPPSYIDFLRQIYPPQEKKEFQAHIHAKVSSWLNLCHFIKLLKAKYLQSYVYILHFTYIYMCIYIKI